MTVKYEFPMGLRVSTLKEREYFYKYEFEADKAKKWLRKTIIKEPVIAIDCGSNSNLFKRGMKIYKKEMVFFLKKNFLNNFRKNLLRYLPEDVYYSRNAFEKENDNKKRKKYLMELMFDLDPENIECAKCEDFKDVYSFCLDCFEKCRKSTLKLYNYLKDRYKFKKLEIVYSGRGFHIHVLDKRAYTLTFKERKKIAKDILKKGYPIDEWVTSSGKIELVRLPYTLHGLVSRICIPLTPNQVRHFSLNSKKAKPKFLY